jgi:mono/diheme cytochrome c family protein
MQMQKTMRWMWILGAPLVVGCVADGDVDPRTGKSITTEPLVLTANTPVNIEGILDYNTVVFAENPTTLLEQGDFHGYEFDGKAGGVVTITMNSSNCNTTDTLLDLFKPEDATGNRGASIAENDDAFLGNCITDAQIKNFRLPVDGTYLIVATTFLQQGGNGHYKLQMTCGNNACRLPGSPTFASTRISQAAIDAGQFTPDALFEIGDFMFETVYRVEDGMGNALTGAPANTTPRPNFRQFPNNVHFAAFGAPEAQTCVTCHNVGGDDGAGDNNHNIFQIGDGINRNSGVPRNPITVLGGGLKQALGEEMTRDLQAQQTAAKAQAASSHANVTKALASHGVSFGSIIAHADGTVDATGLRGIDADLIVKPFGWKGREATIRRFIEGGFRVHFGMQTQPSIVKHCANPNVNTFGNGPNCQDPDGDGVVEEISDGQLSAESVYMGLRETPIRIPAANATAQTRVNQGETRFNSLCASCHTPRMTLANPTHVEKGDLSGGAGITLHLGVDTKEPHPAVASNGSMVVEMFSDLKRHSMGTSLQDGKPFNQIGADQFVTQALWGVRDSAPYLHDGRAATLRDAILKHDGEALAARNSFAALTADEQNKVVEFLNSLGRVEDLP